MTAEEYLAHRERQQQTKAFHAVEYREVREAIAMLSRFGDEEFASAVAKVKLKRPEWFANPGNEEWLWFVHLEKRRRGLSG